MIATNLRVISIALLSIFVNLPLYAQKKHKPTSFPAFLKQASKEARDYSLPISLARLLEISTQTRLPVRAVDVTAEDGAHSAQIILDSNKDKKIALVLLFSKKIDSEHEENHFFKFSPEGKFELAVKGTSQYKDGKVVKGAGKASKVDPGTPGIQEESKRELDFWLSGRYREAQKSSDKKGDAN